MRFARGLAFSWGRVMAQSQGWVCRGFGRMSLCNKLHDNSLRWTVYQLKCRRAKTLNPPGLVQGKLIRLRYTFGPLAALSSRLFGSLALCPCRSNLCSRMFSPVLARESGHNSFSSKPQSLVRKAPRLAQEPIRELEPIRMAGFAGFALCNRKPPAGGGFLFCIHVGGILGMGGSDVRSLWVTKLPEKQQPAPSHSFCVMERPLAGAVMTHVPSSCQLDVQQLEGAWRSWHAWLGFGLGNGRPRTAGAPMMLTPDPPDLHQGTLKAVRSRRSSCWATRHVVGTHLSTGPFPCPGPWFSEKAAKSAVRVFSWLSKCVLVLSETMDPESKRFQPKARKARSALPT